MNEDPSKKKADDHIAWQKQSESLKLVQLQGRALEEKVKSILNWDTGRVEYDSKHGYDLQIDNVYPNKEELEIFVSVTYTKPDTKGHSNENKLQLKVGELLLLKNRYEGIKSVLVIGGSEDSWLPYVLQAFRFFYDEVLFLWEKKDADRLIEISEAPKSVKLKHVDFYKKYRKFVSKIKMLPSDYNPPYGLIRYKVLDAMKAQNPPVDNPDLIDNRIGALCMHRSKRKGGKEWEHFLNRAWSKIEQSRSYFNPLEALVELTLTKSGLKFKGGIAMDVPVPSLLHELGMDNTILSEDFVLFSKKHNKKVYIQCKASGGGRSQHGKNIQNRTKEQITRGVMYSCSVKDGQLNYVEKPFIWLSVLDGDWGVTKRSPLKYVHMLQVAGYDKFWGSEELIGNDLNPLPVKKNPLAIYLIEELDCVKEE